MFTVDTVVPRIHLLRCGDISANFGQRTWFLQGGNEKITLHSCLKTDRQTYVIYIATAAFLGRFSTVAAFSRVLVLLVVVRHLCHRQKHLIRGGCGESDDIRAVCTSGVVLFFQFPTRLFFVVMSCICVKCFLSLWLVCGSGGGCLNVIFLFCPLHPRSRFPQTCLFRVLLLQLPICPWFQRHPSLSSPPLHHGCHHGQTSLRRWHLSSSPASWVSSSGHHCSNQ